MKTVFIQVLAAPVADKGVCLLNSIRNGASAHTVDISEFSALPKSPFAYWAAPRIRDIYRECLPFESEDRTARVGLQTSDDDRFVRLWFEPRPNLEQDWPPFAKGGNYAPFYADVPVVVNWRGDGEELRAFPKSYIRNQEYYFRPGVTWPLRTSSFCPQLLPAGCIPSVRGYGAYASEENLQSMAGVFSSGSFDFFFKMSLGRFGHPEFVIGVLQGLPWPALTDSDRARLKFLVNRAWRLIRSKDQSRETSHAFVVPLLARHPHASAKLQVRVLAADALDSELSQIRLTTDGLVAEAYRVASSDLCGLDQGFDHGGLGDESLDEEGDDEAIEETSEVDATPMVASLLSWALGVAFGRFDVRLATGERDAPPEPAPFDPLPVCSPGMLTGDDGLPVAAPPSRYPLTFPADGILVDDPGHPRDVVRAVWSVFEAVFDDANARWHEAAEILGTPDLRTWFARDFFEPHIKRYSKSRRKAPIYWQLATASRSYSIWIYIHCATSDTLFRVLNDFVGPKLAHEKAKLDGLTQEAGATPSAAQRREIEQQETFVGELQALKTEVARVAPLWKPTLDDGVILTFAPLWRLVPQSRSWQGECKKAWDKLVAGDYDWAHLAMHLWPERVVPKCIDDRSLAIAHGLEGVFWHEDDSGTWQEIRIDDATVQKLIQERTSTTVKAALKDLLSAATPMASKGRNARGRSASPRTSAPKPAPAAVRATTPETALDEATLRAVKGAIASVADGTSKADVLAATGLSDGDWNKAISTLLDRGDVTRTGQKRGTRYHAGEP